MAVFQLGTADTDELFLEGIEPGLKQEFVSNTIVYDRFNTSPRLLRGEFGVMKLQTAGSKSARPSSTSEFPTSRQGSYKEFIFYMKRGMYASLQFDNLALACGQGEGAVRDIVEAEVDGQKVYISNRLNRQYWGDGSGRLAELDAPSANSTSVTIDSPIFGLDSAEYTPAHNYLEEGQAIDIYDTSGNLEAEEVVISSIATDSPADGSSTLTMASAVTASNGSWIFQHDTYASSEAAGTGVPMGLHGIISTANQTIGITGPGTTLSFQNINRASNTFAQAQSFQMGASATVVTNRKILEVVQKCEKKGGTVQVIITNGPIWRSLYEILEADKTMPNAREFWGGTQGINFYGGRKRTIPIIWDDDCPDQLMKFIDDSLIEIVSPSKSGLEWRRGDSGHILTSVAGKDEVVANLVSYYNMTAWLMQGLAELTNVKHDSS